MTAGSALPDRLPLLELAAGIAGAVATQVAHWWASRRKVRADTFKTVVDAMQNRLGSTEHRLDQVEAQHKTCEENLHEVNVKLDKANREIERLKYDQATNYRTGGPE